MKKEAESGWWAFSVAVLMLRDGGEPKEKAKENALKIIDYLYSEKEVRKMESNNIRTMEFIGIDNWDRPVYKCIETGDLYKDITLGSDNHELYSCSNDFEGEPDCRIRHDLEIHFKGTEKQVNQDNKFNYQLLDRLRSDCDYYLGYGNRNVKRLWADNEKEHIEKMKELYNGFSDNEKPEWLTYEQILQYEKLMISSK